MSFNAQSYAKHGGAGAAPDGTSIDKWCVGVLYRQEYRNKMEFVFWEVVYYDHQNHGMRSKLWRQRTFC